MRSRILRRVLCAGLLVALGAASVPRAQAAGVRPVAVDSRATGEGWGTLLACAACTAGAIAIVSGGPGAIAVAINTPGGAQVLLACTASCYDALR